MKKKTFEEICEAFGVIETKKRTMYPRGIQFSNEFLNALQEEYNRQKISESSKERPIKEHSSKMLKALQFHINALDNIEVGLAEKKKGKSTASKRIGKHFEDKKKDEEYKDKPYKDKSDLTEIGNNEQL